MSRRDLGEHGCRGHGGVYRYEDGRRAETVLESPRMAYAYLFDAVTVAV